MAHASDYVKEKKTSTVPLHDGIIFHAFFYFYHHQLSLQNSVYMR
jgi:hypothetical protein